MNFSKSIILLVAAATLSLVSSSSVHADSYYDQTAISTSWTTYNTSLEMYWPTDDHYNAYYYSVYGYFYAYYAEIYDYQPYWYTAMEYNYYAYLYATQAAAYDNYSGSASQRTANAAWDSYVYCWLAYYYFQ